MEIFKKNTMDFCDVGGEERAKKEALCPGGRCDKIQFKIG